MRIILIVAASVLASAALAQTSPSPPPNDKPRVSGDLTGNNWRKTWKLGPDRYAFEGVSGGCHYSGTVTPSGYHYDRSC
jgi:hypothetical protein